MSGTVASKIAEIKQAAKKWDVTPRRIQKLCTDGRIEGATKFGRDWAFGMSPYYGTGRWNLKFQF